MRLDFSYPDNLKTTAGQRCIGDLSKILASGSCIVLTYQVLLNFRKEPFLPLPIKAASLKFNDAERMRRWQQQQQHLVPGRTISGEMLCNFRASLPSAHCQSDEIIGGFRQKHCFFSSWYLPTNSNTNNVLRLATSAAAAPFAW